MTVLLVDTSVWIDFFNGRTTAETELLRAAFGLRRIALGDLILMEVLQGFRHDRDVLTAERLFSELPCHALGGIGLAREAASNYRLLRRQGVTPRSAIDVLVATYCVAQGCDLLASDRDFTLMAPLLGLSLYRPSLN